MAQLMDESNEVYNEQQEAKEKTNELVSLDIKESAEHRAEMDRLDDLLAKELRHAVHEKATKKQRRRK